MPPHPDDDFEIGLTGARFGGTPRRRRLFGRNRDEAESPESGEYGVPDFDDGTGPDDDGVGTTGARFAGSGGYEDPPSGYTDAGSPRPGEPEPEVPTDMPAAVAWAPDGYGGFVPVPPEPVAPPVVETSHRFVRPYVLTRGRTKPQIDLALETLISASPGSAPTEEHLEYARIRELTQQPRSVAEIAALLEVPLGVARVLLADLAGAGGIVVHTSATPTGEMPEFGLMQRVLDGLRKL
jgi:hypothetical protein